MDYTELFDLYIDGRLEGKELEEFNRKLTEDKGFKRSLEEYIELHKAAEEAIGIVPEEKPDTKVDSETDQLTLKDIEKYGTQNRITADEEMLSFKRNISSVEKEFLNGEIPIIKRKLWIPLSVAATVIMVLAITIFFIVKHNRLTNNDLFTEYYVPYIGSENVFEIARSSGNLLFAIKLFESGDYARASILFEQYTDSSDFKEYASLYTGLICMELGKWEDALVALHIAVQTNDNQMVSVARWYLGLCYLRMDDAESACMQFDVLASSKNQYTVRARRILRKIQ